MTKDELAKLIYDNELFHGIVGIGIVMDMTHIEKFAELVAVVEREACAESCNRWIINGYEINLLPQAIRGRGQE